MLNSPEILTMATVREWAGQKLDFSLTPDEAMKYCRLCLDETTSQWNSDRVRYILTHFYQGGKLNVLDYRTDSSLDTFKILLSSHFLAFFDQLNPNDQQQFLIKVLFWLETITSHPSAINPKAVLRNHGKRHRVRGPKPNWFEHYLIRRHDKK